MKSEYFRHTSYAQLLSIFRWKKYLHWKFSRQLSFDFSKLILSFLRLLDRNSQHGVMIQTAHELPSDSKHCNFREFPELALNLSSCACGFFFFFNEPVWSHQAGAIPEQFGKLQALVAMFLLPQPCLLPEFQCTAGSRSPRMLFAMGSLMCWN